jgi:hypothetical protein
MAGKRIGLREIRGLGPGQVVWDSAVSGFAARRQRGAAVAYVLKYRDRRWTPDMAREEAQRLLGDVTRGADPAAIKRSKRSAASVAELCDLYFKDAEAGRLLTKRKRAKKASTLATDRGRIERHIKPLLGQIKVPAVTREDVDGFLQTWPVAKRLVAARPGRSAAWRMSGAAGEQRAEP